MSMSPILYTTLCTTCVHTLFNKQTYVILHILYRPFPKDVHHDYYQDLDLITGGFEPGAEFGAPSNKESESIYANLDELAL